MRVGFTGAQGTGKTTVLKRVEKAKTGFQVIPSTARLARDAGYSLNRFADPMSQLITTVSRIAAEDKAFREAGATLSDRTPLDSLAYTTYQWNNEWNRREKNKFYWDTSLDLVFNHMTKYDAVFYFPAYWEPKADDGTRDEDLDYQEQIDGYIQAYLYNWKIPFFTMPNANTEERFKFFAHELSHLTQSVN